MNGDVPREKGRDALMSDWLFGAEEDVLSLRLQPSGRGIWLRRLTAFGIYTVLSDFSEQMTTLAIAGGCSQETERKARGQQVAISGQRYEG